MTDNSSDFKNLIAAHFDDRRRIPPQGLFRTVSEKTGASQRTVQRAVKQMVNDGLLDYTYEFGCSFLERSFSVPVKIGKNVILAPAGTKAGFGHNDIVVFLQNGASFGSGRHPTSRLACCAVEKALLPKGFLATHMRGAVLDAGCGNGILALCALRLQMASALCLDIDSCALYETKQNARLNKLDSRISIDSTPIEAVTGTFDLILANLRLPTLNEYAPVFFSRLQTGGVFIASGIKTNEMESFKKTAQSTGFYFLEQTQEQDWGCLTFKKSAKVRTKQNQ